MQKKGESTNWPWPTVKSVQVREVHTCPLSILFYGTTVQRPGTPFSDNKVSVLLCSSGADL